MKQNYEEKKRLVQKPTSESVLIYNNLLDLFAFFIQIILQVHLRGIIGIWAENHAAVLPVKWEVRNLWIVGWKSMKEEEESES